MNQFSLDEVPKKKETDKQKRRKTKIKKERKDKWFAIRQVPD